MNIALKTTLTIINLNYIRLYDITVPISYFFFSNLGKQNRWVFV